jgi:hypothetical protein
LFALRRPNEKRVQFFKNSMSDEQTELAVRPDLLERKSVRWMLFVVVPAVVFVLVCAGIRVSTYGIDHTILIFGEDRLVAGWPTAIRITLVSDDGHYFLPTRVSGYLVRGDERHSLFDGSVTDEGYALARNFRVPKLAPGPAELELKINFADKRRVVRAHVEVFGEPPPEKLEIPDDVPASRHPGILKDKNRIDVFTDDRGAPTGLTSVLYIRAVDEAGAPAEIPIEMEYPGKKNGEFESRSFRTDRLGLWGMPLKPLELGSPLKIEGSRSLTRASDESVDGGMVVEAEDAYLYPLVVYGGITAVLHNQLVMSKVPLRASASQISAGGPIYADVYHRGRLVQSASAWTRGSTASFDILPLMPGLNRVQFTTTTLAPGRTVAVRHFYAIKEGEDLTDALRMILKQLESSSIDGKWARAVQALPLERGVGYDRRLAASFFLSRLYAGHRATPMLVSSRSEDDAELSAYKKRFQRGIMIAIILLGFGVALLIALLAFASFRQQQRITMMILSEDDTENVSNGDDNWVTDSGAGTANRRLYLQGIVLFLIILGAFASIALLIDVMSWSS